MKRFLLLAGFFILAITASSRSMAGGAPPWGAWQDGLPTAWVNGPACDPTVDYDCAAPKVSAATLNAMKRSGKCDPYIDYSCLDAYLGDDFATRLTRYYELEWGHGVAPSDPHAPASSRPDSQVPPTPQSVPPMPFSEWPYGGGQNIGKTLPNAADSPLMVALGNTAAGHWLNDAHIQIYGWIDPGANISSNKVRPAGNLPVSYDYTPNTIQLDQAVLYIERVPDEVQNDHFDWGFRVSGIYGVDGRYTTSYGLFSNQLLKSNATNIADMPMVYADLYFPVMQGTNVRLGRFISIPDIEAQLAPNNYTYAHSLTYTWDNYTNTGIQVTQALSKNWILQYGLTVGTEAPVWHWGSHITNQYVATANCAAPGIPCGQDPLYPGASMLQDPGAKPSGTLGIRWTSDSGNDDLNIVADGLNDGVWGYNNLQWIGLTYYHKINDYWHISFESWNIHERNVPNLNNPISNALYFNGGTPFSSLYMPFNNPSAAVCGGAKAFVGGAAVVGGAGSAGLTCTADEQSFLLYVNYSPNKLNNFSLRTEYFMDPQGQRTGVPTNYADVALSWQHWYSPQVEVRPEIGYYRSLDNPAFNGNAAAGIAPNRDWAVIAASDLIFHF
jgi:Putative beta-barrel porin-2, OmpL-like. bbp2